MQTTPGESLVFSSAEQAQFAALSGDFNPIHLDSTEARRLLFGRSVVHGIHALCTALDRQADIDDVVRLRVRFSRPIFPDTAVTLSAPRPHDDAEEITISDREGACAIVAVYRTPGQAPQDPKWVPANIPFERVPKDVVLASAEGISGALPLGLDIATCGRLFPNLTERWPALRIAELLATTRLVGMICPGRHSIFVELDIAFGARRADSGNSLEYRCRVVSRQLGLISISLHGPSAIGEIKALFRPAPVVQSSMNEIRDKVRAGRFSEVDALILGGSRGIGEAVAKIIAAGGGRVCLTYHSGRDDAERVAGEIRSAGGDASTCKFDVLNPEETPVTRFPCIYYCATPAIRRSSYRAFETDDYNHYRSYFVQGLRSVIETFGIAGTTALFYPSTAFLDHPEQGFREYAKAKEDGEKLCVELAARTVRFVCVPRLPRLRTDQTTTLTALPSADPVAALIPWVETMSVEHPQGSVIRRLADRNPE